MSARIYTDNLIEPDDKMLAHDLANTKVYFDLIGASVSLVLLM